MQKKLFFASMCMITVMAFLPFVSRALEVGCIATSDDVTDIVTDISAYIPSNPPDASIEEALSGFSYTAETGSPTYTLVCTVTDDTAMNSAPMVMTAGADIQTFEYNMVSDQEYTFNITVKSADFYIPGNTVSSDEFVIVFINTAENPTLENPEVTGPPAAMGGGYISMNVQEFTMIPPTGPDDMGFGVSLSGMEGVTGFFKMKMPAGMLALMSSMSGKTITASDLGLYIDNMMASTTVEETEDGGVLFSIGITFTEGNTNTETETMGTDSVTKEIVAKEQVDISAAFLNNAVARKAKTTIYGWRKDGSENKKVKIYRKKYGKKKFTLVKQVRTDENGYYSWTFKSKKQKMKKGEFYFKAKSQKKSSDIITLTVY